MAVLPIIGDGVVVDRLVPDDADLLAAAHSDPDNARYQGWPPPLSTAGAQLFIDQMARLTPLALGSGVQLAIREAPGSPLAGDLYVGRPQARPRSLELGITLVPAYQGRGLATAAIRTLLETIFSGDLRDGGVDRIEAILDVDNRRSKALFERLGFRLHERRPGTGERRDGSTADELAYVCTAEDWPQMILGRRR